jgi:hypothetical protein
MNSKNIALAGLSRHPRRTPGILSRARHNAPRETMTTNHRLILALACLPAILATQAHAQDYQINWYTIDGGGEMFTFGGDYVLSGTIGQHDAGALVGGDFELAGGFWPVVAAPPDCVGDFNNDGTVNTLDVLAFLNAWAAGDSSADINGDGTVNTLDVLAFLNAWAAGC